MAFNSLIYIIFLSSTFGVFLVLPSRWRWAFLLLASYVFYAAWDYRYLALIVFVTLVSWAGGKLLSRAGLDSTQRKWCLWGATATVVLLLGVFKYHTMIAQTATALSGWIGGGNHYNPLEVLLPVGISFYTFQAIGYLVDVYRNRSAYESNLFQYALYIAFFPQLVAGPIERANHILPQLKSKLFVSYGNVVNGAALILWGFFKKLVIADRLGAYVDTVYADPSGSTSYQLVLAMYFFSFQIYCDFSGYTDIARGSARILGIELMENFRQPYFASSVRDFWRRWHISLSSWFRDYVFIPLGGSRTPGMRLYGNLLVVFALCGLWHGASWNFVVWGGIHGAMLCVNHALLGRTFIHSSSAFVCGAVRLAKVATVFHLVTLSWVFFRFVCFSDSWLVVNKAFSLNPTGWPMWDGSLFSLGKSMVLEALPDSGFSAHEFMLAAVSIMVLCFVDYATRASGFVDLFNRLSVASRWLACCVLFYVTIIFGWLGVTDFIYFQF